MVKEKEKIGRRKKKDENERKKENEGMVHTNFCSFSYVFFCNYIQPYH